MNKETYLHQLKIHLKANSIPDYEDIIADYEEHFRQKLAEGCSEEEISARLGSPEAIAAQFKAPAHTGGDAPRGMSKFLFGIGVFFADVFVFMFIILLFAWLACIAAFSLACLALGFTLIFEIKISFLYIPFPCNSVLGVSFLALAVLSSVGVICFYCYTVHFIRMYRQWHRSVFKPATISLPRKPAISDRLKRGCSRVALATFGLFTGSFILALFLMFMVAGFKPFWHVWNWFGGVS
ncbi:MAG: DUF1700 domain-containing protein [Clostridiales bacterium]|jgi:uncharacterized membrane protein|nr:DUF1700 domain-containing protein [Clostridiales bacterium]